MVGRRAAAVMTGRSLSAHERIEKAIATMPQQSSADRLQRSQCCEEAEGYET
jgi:hypothetical protein